MKDSGSWHTPVLFRVSVILAGMHIDRERQAQLERERTAAEAEIERLLAQGGDLPGSALQDLRNRVRAIDEELNRMEFATEIERQSDA